MGTHTTTRNGTSLPGHPKQHSSRRDARRYARFFMRFCIGLGRIRKSPDGGFDILKERNSAGVGRLHIHLAASYGIGVFISGSGSA